VEIVSFTINGPRDLYMLARSMGWELLGLKLKASAIGLKNCSAKKSDASREGSNRLNFLAEIRQSLLTGTVVGQVASQRLIKSGDNYQSAHRCNHSVLPT
jgi:hypothetical protein